MGVMIDLTGEKFEDLTVLERDYSRKGDTYWFCQCSCGKITSVTSKNLRRGKTKSCGCKKGKNISNALRKDLVGQRFDRLVVLEFDEEQSKKANASYWKCQCDCGKIKSIAGTSLKQGKTHSCGCYNLEKIHERCFNDLTNQKFGLLTALKWDREKSRISNKTYWICQCECGNLTSVLADSLIRKNTTSCGCLKYSIGEQNILKLLKENNITFIKEYIFPELKRLRYDFYLPDFNRLIEFDGKQHFEDNQKSKWNQDGKFENRKINDKIKNKFALDNNYDLIRIPYWERDNISLDLILGDKYKIKNYE